MITFDEAHCLIKKRDIFALRDAMKNGLNANLENQNAWSLLMSAAQYGDVQIGELLISHGANVNHRTRKNPPTLSGSPLQLAILGGHIPFIQLLLSHGATIDHMPLIEEWIKYSGLSESKMTDVLNIFQQNGSTRSTGSE